MENNSTLNGTYLTESDTFYKIMNDSYLLITIVGLITNLLCIIVFSMIITTFKTNGQMYKYFLMKAICDFIGFIIFLITMIYDLGTDQMHKSFILQFCYIYLFHFLFPIFELYSIYFEVLGTIDCYLSIDNKRKKLLTKKVFIISSFFTIVFFFIFYFGKLFVYKILKNDNHEYYHVKTPLYFSPFYKTLSLIQLFLRDILGSFLSIYFNILIFSSIRKMSEKKKQLRNNLALIKSIEAQESKVKMIYISTLNQILLHLPSFIDECYGKFNKNVKFWANFTRISFLILTLSYVTPFCIYILFNNKFREYFIKLIRIILSIF
jgi:hypothetical protein